MEVEKRMCDALKELFAEELKEADLKGRSEGLKVGRTEGIQLGRTEGIRLTKLVFQLSLKGESPEAIADKCGISPEEVREILE